MAITTYTDAALVFIGEDGSEQRIELKDFTVSMRHVVRDRSCVICGAKDLLWSDGGQTFEACSPIAHASLREVGPHHCLCGHPRSEHRWPGNAHWVGTECMLCAELGEECNRFRSSVRRERE